MGAQRDVMAPDHVISDIMHCSIGSSARTVYTR